MAFAITNTAVNAASDFEARPIPANQATGGPAGASGSLADVSVGAATTTDSTIMNLLVPATVFKAMVYLKTLVGASTLEVKLQVSSSATFASDVVTVDVKGTGAVVATGNTACLTLFGQAPLLTGYQYMRVEFVTGTGTSGTADIIFYAAA